MERCRNALEIRLNTAVLGNRLSHITREIILLYFFFGEHSSMMSSSTGKRKEIYKYLAPWPLYSMNWSVRPDKRFRLALGSFIEEYNNKVQIISLDEETSEFSAKR